MGSIAGASPTYVGLDFSEADLEPEYAGVRLGEIIGWRAWKYDGRELWSACVAAVWLPGEPMGRDHPETKHGLNPGVHAWKTRARAEHYAADWFDGSLPQVGRTYILGTVALWGEVIEHEHGYRAEFGKPHSLDVCVGKQLSEAEWSELRKRYGV